MRKIFLDCGAHRGESVQYFCELYSDADSFEIFCFEANSNFNDIFKNLYVHYINKVVWIENTIVDFYQISDNKGNTKSLASSIIIEKSGPGTRRFDKIIKSPTIKHYKRKIERIQKTYERYAIRGDKRKKRKARQKLNTLYQLISQATQGTIIKKESIDLSNWIIENFNNSDFIILKLDIEGAEYEVLEKMIRDNSINYINKLFIDWHYSKISDIISKERHDNLINKLIDRNIVPIHWDAIYN